MNSVFGFDKKKCKHCGADVEDSEYSNHMIEHIRRAKAVAEYKKKLAERDALLGSLRVKKKELSVVRQIQKRDEAAKKQAAAAEASRKKLDEAKARRESKLKQTQKPCVQPQSGSGSGSSSRPTKSDDEIDRALKEIGSEGHKRAKRRELQKVSMDNNEDKCVDAEICEETKTQASGKECAANFEASEVSDPEAESFGSGQHDTSENETNAATEKAAANENLIYLQKR